MVISSLKKVLKKLWIIENKHITLQPLLQQKFIRVLKEFLLGVKRTVSPEVLKETDRKKKFRKKL